jgi:two-component system response regulator TctD
MQRAMILVVEDDADLAKEIVEVLEADGHLTTVVARVEDALAVTGGVTPSLVLIDLLLGGASGTSLLARLATAPEGPPVLVVSGAQDADQVAAQFGVPLLRKPFTLDALVGAVRDALRSPRRPSRAG